MPLTKNKNLKLFRQRTENMLMLRHGIQNTNAYIEKQLYSFRFMKLSLDGWDNLSVQMMILCFLIGGIAAFGAYWYRCDSYYIVLYGTMGILAGLFMVLVDTSVNISVKRQQLMDCLVDYLDNTPHFFRSVDKSATVESAERRENKNLKVVEKSEPEVVEGNIEQRKFTKLKQGKRKLEAVIGNAGTKNVVKSMTGVNREYTQEEELRKSIDGLKQSLEQIAASQESMRTDVKAKSLQGQEGSVQEKAYRELRPEDLKVLGELLQEYLT